MDKSTFSSKQTFTTANPRLEIKRQTFADGRAAKTTLVGYPILWGETSSDRGGYKVRLAAGSAKFTNPALALYNHQSAAVLGNTANGTLRILAADDIGVPVEIDLPDTTTGSDVATLVADKYIQGMSFSMKNGFEDYDESTENGQKIITVNQFTADEVTITPNPAFTATSIAVKEPDAELSDDDADEDGEDDAAPPAAGGMSEVVQAKIELARLGLNTINL